MSRASHLPTRAALALALLLTTAIPAAAASPDVSVVTTATPTSVTVGHAIGYIVNVANDGGNTLNHVTLMGEIQTSAGDPSDAFEYLGAFTDGVRASQCTQPPATDAFCDFGQLAANTPAPKITFYYVAPTAADTYQFVPSAHVSEGGTDSGNASHVDTFPDPLVPIVTQVLPVEQDRVRGHAILDMRTFTTGLDTLGTGNPHGTTVLIPSATAEVTVRDLPSGNSEVTCPTVLTTCFGQGSAIDVGDGGTIAGGIKVTMRWDVSELPKGMTEKKIRIAHLLGGQAFEAVEAQCVFVGGVPQNMPCLDGAPVKLADKDIQATFYLASNRVSRGY
jgi:hypothetical protein